MNIEFEPDKDLEQIEELLKIHKEKFYSDETDIESARNYAYELLWYFDDTEDYRKQLKVKREFEHIYATFPNDNIIAECYASCLSWWPYDIMREVSLKRDLLRLKTKFPKNEDIAESYSVFLVNTSVDDTSLLKCKTYLNEIKELIIDFPKNNIIKENYYELEKIVDSLDNYSNLFHKTYDIKQEYDTNPNLDNGMEYAKSLFILASVEKTTSKYKIYVETLLSLIGVLLSQNIEMKDIINNLEEASNCFKGELPDDAKGELLDYFEVFNKPVIKVNKETGEVIKEYKSLVDVCREIRIRPKVLENLNIDTIIISNDIYNWVIC